MIEIQQIINNCKIIVYSYLYICISNNIIASVQKRSCKAKLPSKNSESAKCILKELRVILEKYFPDLKARIRSEVPDSRREKSCICKIEELILACVFLHIFRCGSRNGFNAQLDYQDFRKNYHQLTGLKDPHMDTVDAIL